MKTLTSIQMTNGNGKTEMKIETIKRNLEQTITGKVAYLETAKADLICGDYVGGRMAQTALIEFLTLNINELRNILNDVELCISAGAPEWTPMNCPYAAKETCHRAD